MKKSLKKWHYIGLMLLMVLPFVSMACSSDDEESYKTVSVKDVIGQTFKQTVKLNGVQLNNCEFYLEEVTDDPTKLKLTVTGSEIPADYDLQGVEVSTYSTGLGLHIKAEFTTEKTVDGTMLTYSYTINGACSNIGDGKLYFDLNMDISKK